MRQMIRIGMVLVMASVFLFCAACGSKKTEPEHQTIEGVAESIDVASNQVSMRWYNPRKQTEITVPGTVTDQTEILINGRVARLEDIKVGEKVKVTGRIMKEGAARHLVATRIEVTRESPPATAPAAAAPAPPADAE